MEWTIKLLYAILLTSVTGSIWFGAWYGIGTILDKRGYIKTMYTVLRASLVFWCFPFAFLIVAYKNNQTDDGGDFLFFNTPVIKIIGSVFIFAWLLVVTISFVLYLYNIFVTHKRFSGAFECNQEVKECFDEICDRMHIKKRRVTVRQSYMVAVPVCVGIFRPMVAIPVKDYTKDELEVIFVHELNHYKHKDVWIKHFAFIVSCFHCFNPMMHSFRKKLDLWGEYACDDASVTVVGSMKKYFQVILNMTLPVGNRRMLYSPLFEKRPELEYRIEHMQRRQAMKKQRKGIAAFCVLAMAIISTVSVLAVVFVAEKAYMSVYDSTVEEVYDTDGINSEDQTIEYKASGPEHGVREEEGVTVTNQTSGTAGSFSWKIPKNTIMKSTGIYVEAGDTIAVTALCSPEVKMFRIGIIEPDGVRSYVSGTNMLSHTFTIRNTGTYYVYVQNVSSTTEVMADGAYGW